MIDSSFLLNRAIPVHLLVTLLRHRKNGTLGPFFVAIGRTACKGQRNTVFKQMLNKSKMFIASVAKQSNWLYVSTR